MASIHIIIVTGPPTVPGWDLNPGPLSFEASALLTELTIPDKLYITYLCTVYHAIFCLNDKNIAGQSAAKHIKIM